MKTTEESNNHQISMDDQRMLYAVDSVNENYCKQFRFQFGEQPIEKQKTSKKWIIERLIEIDKGTFDTKMWINDPIRFWFNEYRHVLYCHFNSI